MWLANPRLIQTRTTGAKEVHEPDTQGRTERPRRS